MWSRYLNVTDRRTDGRTTYKLITALCAASRGKKYFQCATIPSLTMQVYLHSFSRSCLPKMQSSPKLRENSNLQQFKVIDLGANRKRICVFFLLVSHSNFGSYLAPFLRYGDLLAENCDSSHPSRIRRPRSLCSLWNFAVKWTTKKLESWGYGVPIGTHQRSFERYHPRPPTASSSPRLGVRNPHPKLQSLLSQERMKLKLQIWQEHS